MNRYSHTIPLSCITIFDNEMMKGIGNVFNRNLAVKTSLAPKFEPAIFLPLLLCCSCTFNTGFGLLLVMLIRALSSCQYSGGSCSGCYGHCFCYRQVNLEPVHPQRVGAHGFPYKPTILRPTLSSRVTTK